ncbi:MAG: AsmA family protein, partial [Pseudomonadota bacterium]
MQGLLITIATAVILAIGGAFAAPFVVDWNTWRVTFEQEATRLAGMPVRIRGRIEAELLPAPKLTLRDVTFGGSSASGAEGEASGATVQVLKAEFSLGALMRGQWEARGVELLSPRIRVVLDPAGRLVPPGSPGAASSLSIEQVSVENGGLDVVERAADRTFHISDLDLRGEMRGLSGPLRLEGEAEAGGQRHEVRLSLGKATEDGARLRVITAVKGGLAGDLDGLLRLQDAIPRFEGKGLLTKSGRAAADLPWRVSGAVRISPDALVAESIEAILGDDARPLTLAGSARFSFGRAPGLDMVLNGRAADADPVLGAGGPVRSPAEAAAALAHLFTDLAPPSFPIRIGAAVDQLTLGGTVVREARLDLTGLPSGWRIDGAEAKLPGQTSVRLSGIPAPAPSTTFAGDLVLTSQEPAAFLRWAAPAAAGDYVGMLAGPVRLSTRLDIGADRIAADAVKMSLGNADISGRASLAWATPLRAVADLTLAGLDLDPLIAGLKAGLAASGGQVEGSLALRGRELRLSGLPVSRMALAAESAAGGWVLKSLDVEDLAGLKISGHGRFSRLVAPIEGDLALDLSGSGAEGMVPLARLVAGAEAGDVMARLAPIAAPVALTSRARWSGGGSETSAEGTLGLLSGRAVLARGRSGAPERAEIALAASDAARALAAAGFMDARPGLGAARFDLSLVPARAGAARLEGRLSLA